MARTFAPFVLSSLIAVQAWAQPALQFADLGDFPLENGAVIQDCRIGYRTFGELNAEKSNAILYPTWFGGTSENLSSLIGPGKLVARIQSLAMQTPQYRVRQTSRKAFPTFLATIDSVYATVFVTDNWASQLKAMMAHDVSAPFGGSLEKAAAVVRAELLVIVATQDHVVNPRPALEFARLAGGEILRLNSDCGHLAVGCEMQRVVEAVAEFLER